MPANFNNFQQGSVPTLTDNLVGFATATPGGERKWTFSSLKSWIASFVNPSLNKPKILASGVLTGTTEPSLTTTFTVSEPGWLVAVGDATASYQTGRVSNAGNYAFVSLNGVRIASNMAFEGESYTINFYSNAVGMALVQPNVSNLLRLDHNVTTTSVGATQRLNCRLSYMVLPVNPNPAI